MSDQFDNAPSGINRRLKPRYAVDLKVEMLTKGLDHYVAERCANVSLGGLFVCTSYSAELNETVHLRIIFSDKEAYFDVKSEVAWICDDSGPHPQGLGLRFIDLSDDQIQVINRILREYVNVQTDT